MGEIYMRSSNIIIVGVMLFSLSCAATSPLIKKDELPEEIRYYSENQKFNVVPEWYWRFRPTRHAAGEEKVCIGKQYLVNKAGNAEVIGEIIVKKDKFFVVQWGDNGYYFIREKDYNFALQFKKYILVPQKKRDIGANTTLFYALYNCGIYSVQSYDSDQFIQLKGDTGLTNMFLKVPSNYTYRSFCENQDIRWFKAIFAAKYIGIKQYENANGFVLNGEIYQAQYILCDWGEEQYAIPCER